MKSFPFERLIIDRKLLSMESCINCGIHRAQSVSENADDYEVCASIIIMHHFLLAMKCIELRISIEIANNGGKSWKKSAVNHNAFAHISSEYMFTESEAFENCVRTHTTHTLSIMKWKWWARNENRSHEKKSKLHVWWS